jgi:hypothetical protein
LANAGQPDRFGLAVEWSDDYPAVMALIKPMPRLFIASAVARDAGTIINTGPPQVW